LLQARLTEAGVGNGEGSGAHGRPVRRPPAPASILTKAAALAPKMDRWTLLAAFLLLGYGFGGRTFAYVGIPPAKIFIGDVALACFIAFHPRAIVGRWVNALTKSLPLSTLAWMLLLFVFYGFAEVVRGVLLGYPPITAVENFVFNVYPLYLFLGIWAGTQYPELLLKLVRIMAWGSAIYGPLYLLVLHNVQVTLPGSDGVPLFSQAGGGSFTILSLLCLERKPSRYWFPIGVSAFMLLATQVRAEWLGFVLALLVWGILGRKMDRVFLIGGLVIALLAVGWVADVKLPSTAERGGAISSREIVARGVAAVSPDAAEEYTSNRNAAFYAGTITWRTKWWHAIWDSVHEDVPNTLFGHGYGYPLKDLVSYLKGMDIRTPHSVFYYALGYTGWIGVGLFFGFQFVLAWLLWRAYKFTRQPIGLVFWTLTLSSAFFGNFFETPAGAISFYLFVGIMIVPGLRRIPIIPQRFEIRKSPGRRAAQRLTVPMRSWRKPQEPLVSKGN
jgi:hypothetical protein